MRSLLIVPVLCLASLASPCWAGPMLCLCRLTSCESHPGEYCPKCTDPCACRLPLGFFASPEKTRQWIDSLCSDEYCLRRDAVRKLSSRFHADFCKDPCVLQGLITAMFCDPTWEIRRQAAFGIYKQKARTEAGILALYISSRMDPHVMGRAGAHEALRLLMIKHRGCEKDIVDDGEKIVKVLKAKKFKLGKKDSVEELEKIIASEDEKKAEGEKSSKEKAPETKTDSPAPEKAPTIRMVVPGTLQMPMTGVVVPNPVQLPAPGVGSPEPLHAPSTEPGHQRMP